MIDSHLHLDYLKEKSLDEIIQDSKDHGVDKLITISVDPENLQRALYISNQYEDIFCTQGIHPHDAKSYTPEVEKKIIENTKNNKKVVAVGEIGLDFHYNHSTPEIQKKVFHRQLELATELKKPIVVHTREAEEETIKVLSQHLDLEKKGVIHSFSSKLNVADFALKNGFYLGFNGMITFKSAQMIREAVAMTPIEKILLETDAPFLTPAPHRGKENAPKYLRFIAEKVAEIKDIHVDEVIEITTQNVNKLFSLNLA